jgi:hypothetical protein
MPLPFDPCSYLLFESDMPKLQIAGPLLKINLDKMCRCYLQLSPESVNFFVGLQADLLLRIATYENDVRS